jgi:hypothetical protein
MTAEQHAKLRAMLVRLGAEDLAVEVAAVEDVRDLDENVRGAIIDALGAEAAARVGRPDSLKVADLSFSPWPPRRGRSGNPRCSAARHGRSVFVHGRQTSEEPFTSTSSVPS